MRTVLHESMKLQKWKRSCFLEEIFLLQIDIPKILT